MIGLGNSSHYVDFKSCELVSCHEQGTNVLNIIMCTVLQILKRRSFRSKKIIQGRNIPDSVLLSLFMRDTEKCNISHAP